MYKYAYKYQQIAHYLISLFSELKQNTSDMTVAIHQPIGQEIQIPNVESSVLDKKIAKIALKSKSVNVAIINLFISPLPFKTPSAISFNDAIK